MKVLKGILVDHTNKESLDSETRFYKTTVDTVEKNDVFVVWAHGRLGFFKVRKVFETFEYLTSENGGVDLEDVPLTLNKVNNEEYKLAKAVLQKEKRIKQCIKERIAEAEIDVEVEEGIKKSTPAIKEAIKELQNQLKMLKEHPETALED